jgi:hypothetical protein
MSGILVAVTSTRSLLGEQTMNEPNWPSTYYAVFACACIAVVVTTLTVADAAARIKPILQGDNQSPGISKVMMEIPVPVYYAVGASTIVLISLLGIYRRQAFPLILSSAILAICIYFNTIALWAL